MALGLQWDSDVCSLSHFHNLFEEFCSIFIEPNVQAVDLPDCDGPVTAREAPVSGQDRVWGAGGSERHNTGNVLLAPSQDHSTQMVQDKRRAWPTSFSCSSSLPLSPPGSVPSPPISTPHHIDKRPCSKYPKCGSRVVKSKGEWFSVTQCSH